MKTSRGQADIYTYRPWLNLSIGCARASLLHIYTYIRDVTLFHSIDDFVSCADTFNDRISIFRIPRTRSG